MGGDLPPIIKICRDYRAKASNSAQAPTSAEECYVKRSQLRRSRRQNRGTLQQPSRSIRGGFRNLAFRHAAHRANALGRKVTSDELARPELTHDRLLVCAPGPGQRTARVKTAAGRWRIR
jgi:hypothetical protein